MVKQNLRICASSDRNGITFSGGKSEPRTKDCKPSKALDFGSTLLFARQEPPTENAFSERTFKKKRDAPSTAMLLTNSYNYYCQPKKKKEKKKRRGIIGSKEKAKEVLGVKVSLK